MSIYQAGQIKRARSTKAEVERRRARIAVNPEQISAWRLPSRPTKPTDSRAKNFGEVSVELDAIRPDLLRELVESTIQRHLPPDQFKVLKAAEASERQLLEGLVGMIGGQLS